MQRAILLQGTSLSLKKKRRVWEMFTNSRCTLKLVLQKKVPVKTNIHIRCFAKKKKKLLRNKVCKYYRYYLLSKEKKILTIDAVLRQVDGLL